MDQVQFIRASIQPRHESQDIDNYLAINEVPTRLFRHRPVDKFFFRTLSERKSITPVRMLNDPLDGINK